MRLLRLLRLFRGHIGKKPQKPQKPHGQIKLAVEQKFSRACSPDSLKNEVSMGQEKQPPKCRRCGTAPATTGAHCQKCANELMLLALMPRQGKRQAPRGQSGW